jgi:hypothetical protein
LQGIHGQFSDEIANCDRKLLTHVTYTKGLCPVR